MTVYDNDVKPLIKQASEHGCRMTDIPLRPLLQDYDDPSLISEQLINLLRKEGFNIIDSKMSNDSVSVSW